MTRHALPLRNPAPRGPATRSIPAPTRFAAVVAALFVAAALMSALPAHAGARERCVACGELITGAGYLEVEGHAYHPGCFTCAGCDAILEGAYYPHAGRNWCPACYARSVAPRCVVCDRPIVGTNYTLNPWMEATHPACRASLRQCDVCSRTLGGLRGAGAVPLQDGRSICTACATGGVTDHAAARGRLAAVAAAIRSYGVDVDVTRIELHLSGRDALRRLSGRDEAVGFTESRAGNRRRGRAGPTIRLHVLSYLGPDRFDAVVAHELTHVYLRGGGGPRLPVMIEEGFCNYVASLILVTRKGPLAQQALRSMERDDDPEYGDGFRRVRDHARRRPLGEILGQLRAGRVPEGM